VISNIFGQLTFFKCCFALFFMKLNLEIAISVT
jgi:hypothetical protein